MDKEYIKKLQSMKPSEVIEEIFGIKLLYYQKMLVDLMDKNQKYYITFSPYLNCIDTRYIKGVKDALYPLNR